MAQNRAVLKDELRSGLKVGGRKQLIERLLGPGEIEDELDCDVPMAVTAMSPTVLIGAATRARRAAAVQGLAASSAKVVGHARKGFTPAEPCPTSRARACSA